MLKVNVNSFSTHVELSYDTLHAYLFGNMCRFQKNIEQTIGHFMSNIQSSENCIKVDFKIWHHHFFESQ